jgi:hypothetical protein
MHSGGAESCERWTTSGGLPGRAASRSGLSTPSAMKRGCQRQLVGLPLPVCCWIAMVPTPRRSAAQSEPAKRVLRIVSRAAVPGPRIKTSTPFSSRQPRISRPAALERETLSPFLFSLPFLLLALRPEFPLHRLIRRLTRPDVELNQLS